jgi:polyphosphate kinase
VSIRGQARNPANPLLERVKFLAIVSSNLDEFFEIRVAGLMQQADSKVPVEPSLDGITPREQLEQIYKTVRPFVAEQYTCWQEELIPLLQRESIVFRTVDEFDEADRQWLKVYFETQVLPVLTPLAVDQSHPFPWIGNKTLNMLLALDETGGSTPTREMTILPVPRVLPRIVALPSHSPQPPRYVFLTEIIRSFAGALFPGYEVTGAYAFRVTRNSDLYIDEEEAENLLKKIEIELRN